MTLDMVMLSSLGSGMSRATPSQKYGAGDGSQEPLTPRSMLGYLSQCPDANL